MKSGLLYHKLIYNWFLDIILPEKCLGCHKGGFILCPSCIISIRSAERETSSGIMAAYDYRDPVIKKAIWKLKYYKGRHLGQKLGAMLYETFMEDVADIKMLTKGIPILVIPVPLTQARKKMRGYNQAEVIARAFCDCEVKEVLELASTVVIKKGESTPQARITNRVARLRNIRGAFEIIKPDIVRGRSVIIIDDVTTTGGTITEIIKILKKTGAKKVIGLALAH